MLEKDWQKMKLNEPNSRHQKGRIGRHGSQMAIVGSGMTEACKAIMVFPRAKKLTLDSSGFSAEDGQL